MDGPVEERSQTTAATAEVEEKTKEAQALGPAASCVTCLGDCVGFRCFLADFVAVDYQTLDDIFIDFG